jgi:subtilisin family serine protease
MKLVRVLFLFALIVLMFGSTSTILAQSSSKNHVEGELLVKFKNGAVSPEAIAANEKVGATILKDFSELGWQQVKLPAKMTIEEALAQYRNSPEVEYAQPNFIYKLAALPNDARFSELYGLQKIGAPAAWDITIGSAEVVVAVIDTGVRYTHEDLIANMWRNAGETPNNNFDDDGNGFIDDYYGYDFFFNDSNPIDENGHGTHVAGTIGASGNNAVGVAGVNWNVRLMAIKIYNSSGNGSTSAMLVNAYNYVRMMKNRGVNIRVTNNSYGGCDEACGYDQATKDAIDALGEAGVLNVFAAGNNNSNNENTPFYPSSYNSPSILSVAASDASDNRAGFSNYGATSVDLAAPGAGILSTVNNSNNSSYGTLSGTSMAAPHVSGAAALLAAAQPDLSAASLKATLLNRVDALAQWTNFVKTGGRLNVARAIQQPTNCNFSFSFAPNVIAATGGGGTISVGAAQNCDFSAISQSSWITVASGNPGSGNATVNFNVAANSGAPRTGTIRIAGQNISIPQAGNNTTPPENRAILDFDGDGKTDFSVLQNLFGSLVWHNLTASGYRAANFGLFTDAAVPADYDGDGKTDVAVWRAGVAASYFYVLNSSDNTFQAVQWGAEGDEARVAQDFDGDNRADFAVTRKTGGALFWYVRQSSNAQLRAVQFGSDGDAPVRGDYDGDGKADISVYRPATGNPANTFFVLKSSDGGLLTRTFGSSATDCIVPGDFDGDRRADFAVWRTTNGFWYWIESSNGNFRAAQFGQNGDLPAPGDYDGDGKTDLTVWRANASVNEPAMFFVNRSAAGFAAVGWGQNGMRVTANSLQVGN